MNEKSKVALDVSLISAAMGGNLNIIKDLIEKGANIHAVNDCGNNALMISALRGNLDVVKYLLEQGTEINAQNNAGNNALVPAASSVSSNRLEVIKFLIEKGINIHVNNDKALNNASYYGYLDVVKYFIVEQNCEIKMVLETAEEGKQKEIITWCKNYIKSKNLNDKLGMDLLKNSDKLKGKKIKI